MVVGATKFGWMFGMSRKWGQRMLRMWAEEQANGGPNRVFVGVGGALYTTLPVVHQYMPPGRDLALYRRVETLEKDVAEAHKRIDRNAMRLTEVERAVARFGNRKTA